VQHHFIQNIAFWGSQGNSEILNTGKEVNAALHHLRQPSRCQPRICCSSSPPRSSALQLHQTPVSPPQRCKSKSRESAASRIKNNSSSRVDWGRLSPSNQDATERRAIPEAEAARNGLDVDLQAAVRLASCRGLDLQNFSAAFSKGIVCHEQGTGAAERGRLFGRLRNLWTFGLWSSATEHTYHNDVDPGETSGTVGVRCRQREWV